MRRSKGEGAVYRRKNGLWVARYEAAGRRKYLYGKTKRIVTDRLKEKMGPEAVDLASEAEAMLVGEYLDRWLPTVKETIKERTWVRHEHVVRFHLKPIIGGIRMQKLGPMDLHELYRMKLEGGLSPRSVQLIHTTLNLALKRAVTWSLVRKAVTQSVTPPREEINMLLTAAKGERFEALYVLAVTTGTSGETLLVGRVHQEVRPPDLV